VSECRYQLQMCEISSSRAQVGPVLAEVSVSFHDEANASLLAGGKSLEGDDVNGLERNDS